MGKSKQYQVWLTGFITSVLMLMCGVLQAEPLRHYRQQIIAYSRTAGMAGADQVEGAFAGFDGEALLVAGGASRAVDFNDYRPMECADTVRVLYNDAAGNGYQIQEFALEKAAAYGACVSVNGGLLCIGGTDGSAPLDDVILIHYDPIEKKISVRNLAELPKAVVYGAAAATGSKVYVFGGSYDLEGRLPNDSIYILDLNEGNGSWETVGMPGYEGSLLATSAVQNDGFGNKIFVFGGIDRRGKEPGYSHNDTVYKIDPAALSSESSAPLPKTGSFCALPVGQSHIFLYPGDSGGDVLVYHAITDTWAAIGEYAGPAELLTAASVLGKTYLVGREEPSDLAVIQAEVTLKNSKFGILDYGCLTVYLVLLVLMGFYFSKREKSTDDFFLGGRRIPYWAAALSLIGTGLSAITYIATPAAAYASDWHRLVPPLLMPIGIFVQIYLMLPFFRRLNVTTAYEYLEYRFSIVIRIFASLSFIVLQLGRMGVVLFLPAIALSASTGMNVVMCILFMGVLCTIYTVLGGIEAVIWTDVIQVIIFYACAVMMLVIILMSLDGGVNEFINTGMEHSKFHIINPGWDLTTTSITVMVMATFANILLPMTDQTIIQRWLTTKDEKSARKAIAMGALIGIPSAVVFFLIGAALFVFYKDNPENLNPVLMTDGIVPWFAVQQLPPGVSGLLIAAIFAASMSSMDSSMNSLATAIVTDFYKRFRTNVSDHGCLILARWLTVVFGAFGTGMALLFASTDIKSLVDLISKYNGLFGGGLAGVFLLGMLTERTNVFGSIVGILVSGAVVYYVQAETAISFFLYFAVGLFACMITGYAASLLTGGKKVAPAGMTVYTLMKESQ